MMREYKISFIGDVVEEYPVLREALQADGSYDFRPCFAPLSPLFAGSDYVVANLETPLGGEEAGYTKDIFSMNTPDSIVDALLGIGVTAVTTANNHMMDRGIVALRRTCRVLDEKGMAHTGTYDITPEDRNLYFTLGDTRIALLSYAASANYGANKKYDFSTVYEHANFLRPYDSPLMRAPESSCVKETFAFVEGLLERKLGFEEKAMLRKAMHQPVAFGDDVFDRAETDPFFEALRRDYEKARKNADVVIICPHSGGQFNTEPGEVSKYFFGQMAKIGFDAVVAAHSHTTQRVEKQGGTIIANCLGNVSMSPLTGYMSSVKETLSTYGMALHFYVAGGRIKRAAFSLFNAVQTGTQPMRVIPVCDYLSVLPDEEKTAASAEIAQIYKRITGREMNSVEKEWALF